MSELNLNGNWELRDEPLTTAAETPTVLTAAATGWLRVAVPGDIHPALIAAGRLKEPLLGLNSFDCAWTEDRSWWFRRKFPTRSAWRDADRVELVLGGLDANAAVYLNGQPVATHRNAFYPLVAEVKPLLAPAGEENVLLVRLTTGVETVTEQDFAAVPARAPTEKDRGRPERGDPRRVFVRKPQYSFGWDWSPRVATTAIADDVTVRVLKTACLRDVQVTARQLAAGVELTFTLTVESFHDFQTGAAEASVRLVAPDGETRTATASFLRVAGLNYVTLRLMLAEPQLWWPAGLGEQALYRVLAEVRTGGQRLRHPGFSYGIRFIELETDGVFAFRINGRRVFCRGANWIPADAIYARVGDDQYRELVRQARDANFTMLRVWGGGQYEREAFYQACDRDGILVWQEFAFACAAYPDQLDWFRREVEHEADYQTRRLRHHPSLVLWCGNNECNWGLANWWRGLTSGGWHLYNYLLPNVVRRNCPEIPYWNGSPYGGAEPNASDVGDRHHWGECMMNPEMQKRITPEEYDRCTSLFVSEFGYVGPCGRETTVRYLDGAPLDRQGQVWRHHNNTFEQDTVDAGIRKHYADPEHLSVDQYLLYAGLTQGLMYGYALEAMRFRPECHGALFWMYNDCWGEVGWTIVDYYRQRKISWYFVRRAFAPVRLILRKTGRRANVVAANDGCADLRGTLEYGFTSLDGQQQTTHRCQVMARAGTRTTLVSFLVGPRDPSTGLYFARLLKRPDVAPATLRLSDFRNLATPPARLEYQVTGHGGGRWTVRVRSDAYAHAVHLELPPGAVPDDDYFDLLPGEVHEVGVVSRKALTKANLRLSYVRNGA